MTGKILAFIFGSIVGSFLNVCIYRMPEAKSVVWPGSHCPECEKRIPWYDNIPFVSYLALRGRCRFCKKRISPRYLAVELLTALLFVLFYQNYRLSYDLFFYLVLCCLLIISSFTDIKHRIIPDEVSVGGLIVGFILSSVKGLGTSPLAYNFSPLLNSLSGIIVGGAVIYLTGLAFDKFYFKLLKRPPIQGETESMGGGDVKLLAMIGAFLGWQQALLVFVLAPFLGVIFGIPNLLLKKDHTMPYGPFLSLAAIVAILWSDKIFGIILIR
jgi:leader peptidase (prepilin peptidase)/N-methyltransferase